MSILLNDVIAARGPFAQIDDGQISGSLHVVSSFVEMQNIPTYVRKPGMFASIEGVLYYLGLDLVTWTPMSGSGGGGGLLPTGSAGTFNSLIQVNAFGQVTSGSSAALFAGLT